MAVTLLPRTTRSWSWLLGASAVLLPVAFYTWQALTFSRWVNAQEGLICGMPLLMALGLAILLSGLLSCLAFVVGLVGYRSRPKPRSRRRVLELVLVGLPAILLTAGLLVAIVSALWA